MITQEQIRRKAFKIYQQRQKFHIPGTAESDWQEAEEELQDEEENE